MAHPFPFQGSAGGSHMSGIVGTGVDHGDCAVADDIRSGAIIGERPRVPCEHAPDTGSQLLNFAIAGGEIICHVSHVAMSGRPAKRSEEHTSELQSLMRISYAVFCLKKNTRTHRFLNTIHN